MILKESTKKWSNIITEELGIQDKSKLGWMSNYAAFHEIYEGLQSVPNADAGIYATPLNTIGMGNPAFDDGEMTEPIAPICKKRKKKKKKTEEE